MHDLANGDLVECQAGVFRISNRRISRGHRGLALTQAEYDAPENRTDVLVFDGHAVDPDQPIREWRLQGNHLRMVGLLIEAVA